MQIMPMPSRYGTNKENLFIEISGGRNTDGRGWAYDAMPEGLKIRSFRMARDDIDPNKSMKQVGGMTAEAYGRVMEFLKGRLDADSMSELHRLLEAVGSGKPSEVDATDDPSSFLGKPKVGGAMDSAVGFFGRFPNAKRIGFV